jgi:hypothetical protein
LRTAQHNNAKTFFGKAIPLAENDEDKTGAKNWLTKRQTKLHKSRIERSREGNMLVENRERAFTRFHMKEYKLMEERPVMRDQPILPQTAIRDSPRKLIQYFRNTIPSFNGNHRGRLRNFFARNDACTDSR